MKRTTCYLLGLMIILGTTRVQAQPGGGLSQEHKILKKDVGDWDSVMKIYPQGPDGPAIESKGEEHNRLIGDGMWLVSDFKSELAGVPFEGHGTFGYDPVKKKYTGTWVDSMKPTMDVMEGDYDAKTQTMTLITKTTDPETGKPTKMKNVGKSIDKNTRTFTLSALVPGSENKYMKIMEIHYTRREKQK